MGQFEYATNHKRRIILLHFPVIYIPDTIDKKQITLILITLKLTKFVGTCHTHRSNFPDEFWILNCKSL